MAQGIKWYGLPIVDGAAPNSSFLEAWRELGPHSVMSCCAEAAQLCIVRAG